MTIIGMLVPLGITIGALLIAVQLLQRWKGGHDRGSGVPLEILKRIPCGPRQGIALLRVGQRVFVVSLAESGAQALTELTGRELADALAAPTAATPRGWMTRHWPAVARFSIVVALVVASSITAPYPAAAMTTQEQQVPGVSTATARPPQFDVSVGDDESGLHLSGAVGVVVLMAVLTLLPALFLMMTSFTRILVVLHFLRAAIGTQTTPPGQLLAAIAVLLTGVVMAPTLEMANQQALQPFLNGDLTQVEAYRAALIPFREFMVLNTRETDLGAFAEMSGHLDVQSIDDIPTPTVMSAFVTSELKTAFQIGFVIFLPFTVVDLVVASVLMSMGMFMLPPVMVSLPFKLLLFVLADGWTLVVQNLVASFNL